MFRIRRSLSIAISVRVSPILNEVLLLTFESSKSDSQRTLLELASNPNKVFSREDLLETVWDYDYLGDGRLVDVHIRRLRTKVEMDPANPRYVLTVRGMGYKLQT